MKILLPLAFLAACGPASTVVVRAQQNSSGTICARYTELLFGNNTADNQLALTQAVVNLAVLGNADVPGILASDGGLVGFFSGAGPTTNRGGEAVVVNFLDGAAGLPDNLDESSNTAFLLNHLYQFFGAWMGCAEDGFPAYDGVADMYEVHKFMNINKDQNDYFIGQVGAAASFLGVTDDDVAQIASSLDGIFNERCTQPLSQLSPVPSFLVGTNPSICQSSDCPVEDESACPANATEAPAGDSICNKYTPVLFGNNTADNQLALIQTVVNLAVLGDESLPGILAAGAGLVELFNGAGPTTNRGGDEGVVVNFLDGAGGLPDNLDASSNTAFLLNHLYQFFGALLGCTEEDFPAYEGVADMYEVHKFMFINNTQMNYFNSQVAGAASSLGVSDDDVATIGAVLDKLFNQRCIPELTADSGVPDILVGTNPSICQTLDCPVADESACPVNATEPPATEAPSAAPADGTICSKYTPVLFGNNTADNQLALIQTVVNLAVLGDESLPGILAAGGGLLELFNGAGPTTNRGGDEGVVVNFLDGAGGLPDNLNATSNTAFLLNHLYQFFGALLGCTEEDFPSYQGVADMYEVHKFMFINNTQMNYFNSQVAGAALSLGVSEDDVATIGAVLDKLFNQRCTPELTADSGVPDIMVGTNPSICQTPDCPVADESACPDAGTDAPAAPPTICSKYTVAIFVNDTADNQLALMQAVVNLAVLGDESLPGILAAGGGLVALFDGSGNTTNRGGDAGVAVNFLDGASGLPDNLDANSNTAFLLNHLYQFFGALLGCTEDGFPSYQGVADMYEVHKFMFINNTQMNYFNSQVAGAASSLGVSDDDVATIGSVLNTLFNQRCTPELTADAAVPDFMVGTNPSICHTPDCPVANESACIDDGGEEPTSGSIGMPAPMGPALWVTLACAASWFAM
jgi:hypothetical protein